MVTTINDYCQYCNKDVLAEKKTAKENIDVKGESFCVEQDIVTCGECGRRITDSTVEDGNLKRAYSAYRNANSLLTPEEISAAYSNYKLSQASFGKLLGLGATTISRYENGGLQTKQIDAAIRSAIEPVNMIALLNRHKDDIPKNQYQKALSIAQNRKSDAEPTITQIRRANFDVIFGNEKLPSEENGYRTFHMDRIREAALFFATNCKDFYMIKFNKAFFYADMSSYLTTSKSITGLVYANAPQGPIIDGYDYLKGILTDGKNLSVEVHDFGEYEAEELIPLRDPDMMLFSQEERKIMINTAAFLNSFRTSKLLSDFTHDELAWKETSSGQIINYSYAYSLNGAARITAEFD